jgi:acetyltransferase-like isoleucine patch superfamily enzyme/acyl carrier protein
MIPRAFGRFAVGALDEVRSRVAFRSAARLGRHIRLFGWPRVANEGELVIGSGVSLVSTPSPVNLVVAPGGSLVIGDRALIESGAAIRARGRVTIGSSARVGAGCIVDDDGAEASEISIGDGAWVEEGAVLLAGTRVAPGSVFRRGPADAGRAPRSSDAPHSSDGASHDAELRVRAVLGRLVPGASSVDRTASLSQMKGWDSLAALRTLVALEKEFAVMLPHQLFARHPTLESVMPVILASISKHAEME